MIDDKEENIVVFLVVKFLLAYAENVVLYIKLGSGYTHGRKLIVSFVVS